MFVRMEKMKIGLVSVMVGRDLAQAKSWVALNLRGVAQP